ncbi:response regulator [Halobacteriovorax sp. GB3]|uniref:response regulator n=1 Tax=Halobacteriovorax sp. GB3 TaxID=2719615 RepID=UPI00236143F7|nr:response regulator [Halobacteriovorax sp. GB3]MDD0852071.1 response regulator [Halobacteriovorax sp. GB3]
MGKDILKDINILVVDDEEEIKDILRHDFTELGANVHFANDGKDALDKIFNQNFDVILTDVAMPGYDGLQLIEEMTSSKLAIPIVVMTGYLKYIDELEHFDQIVRVIQKPFNVQEVASILKHAVLEEGDLT